MEEVKKKRRRNAFDRIVLTSETQDVLTRMMAEVADVTNGMVNLQGRELANFLIQTRCQPLTHNEVTDLRAKFFDDSKAATWMVNQIREARANGESVDLAELIKKLQMQSVVAKTLSRRVSKARNEKQPDAPRVENEGSAKPDQTRLDLK